MNGRTVVRSQVAGDTAQHVAQVGDASIAYRDEGSGAPVLLLHGCPFASFVWRQLIPQLMPTHRCIAPDLLGLGDTETPPGADWSLPAQAAAMVGLLDSLGIERAHVLGHDHGGAIAQVLAARHPARVNRLVLADAEACDNWPSAEERPFVRITQLPLVGDLVLWLWSRRVVLRSTLVRAKAVRDAGALTPEFVDLLVRANLGDRHRRAKMKRFIAEQFDPRNNRVTLDILAGLRRFDHPTLLIWAENDAHFGPEWGERLRRDIPGAQRLELLASTGHLLMEEQPAKFAALVRDFLA
jgi:pimeloyl-ACP methyl ester carboxylesterase